MQKVFLFLAVIAVLFSCNKNDDGTAENKLFGDWRLIQMTGSLPNSERSGIGMEWQENYVLHSDGTFQKLRIRDGVVTEVSGIYRLIKSSNGRFLEFVFNSKSEIIGSCDSNLKEEMFFQSENTFSSTWENCDGPGLIYQKVD